MKILLGGGVKLLQESAVTYYMGPSMGGQIITSMGSHLLNRTFDDGHLLSRTFDGGPRAFECNCFTYKKDPFGAEMG